MNKTKVLFLCTGNAARSQMAEAFLRTYAGDQFEAYSAGLEPTEIHPYTKQVMQEVGIDLNGHHAKALKNYMGKKHFGYLITVCSNADKNCPSVFPGMGQRLHWDLEDPVAFEGVDEAKLQKFREVRDQLDQRLKAWLAEQGIVANAD
jgi:arsenate reductase